MTALYIPLKNMAAMQHVLNTSTYSLFHIVGTKGRTLVDAVL